MPMRQEAESEVVVGGLGGANLGGQEAKKERRVVTTEKPRELVTTKMLACVQADVFILDRCRDKLLTALFLLLVLCLGKARGFFRFH